jgi:hypothetical protein
MGEEGVAELHFPGLHPTAAQWLCNRGIGAVGIDTASIDYGQSRFFDSHRVLAARDIPILENVAHLERLPLDGAWVVALADEGQGRHGATGAHRGPRAVARDEARAAAPVAAALRAGGRLRRRGVAGGARQPAAGASSKAAGARPDVASCCSWASSASRAVVEVSGSVLLTGASRPGVGFLGEAITFSDSTTAWWAAPSGPTSTAIAPSASCRPRATSRARSSPAPSSAAPAATPVPRVATSSAGPSCSTSDDGSVQGQALEMRGRIRARDAAKAEGPPR